MRSCVCLTFGVPVTWQSFLFATPKVYSKVGRESSVRWCRETQSFGFQNVSQDGRAAPADVLRHADLCAVHLRLAAFTAQLLDHLHDLIHARRADRMTARFQPATRADRHRTFERDAIFEAESWPLAAFRETARFQRKCRHN